MKKVIFTVDQGHLDPFDPNPTDCPFCVGCFHVSKAHYDFSPGLDISKVPDDLNPVNTPEVREDIDALQGIQWRMRFSNNESGPFLLSIDSDEFTREELEMVIQCKFRDRTLKDFLKAAKF